MSRIIKFRAWHPAAGDPARPSKYTYWKLGTGLDNSVFFNSASAVEQFTGLLDKNGKEIYEGDIVKWEVNTRGGPLSQTEEVMFKNGSFVLFCPKYSDEESFYDEQDFATEYQVIGNIHENPELRK